MNKYKKFLVFNFLYYNMVYKKLKKKISPDKKKANNEMSEIFDIREFLAFHKSSK